MVISRLKILFDFLLPALRNVVHPPAPVARGAVMSLAQCWGLARAWYADRLSPDWRRRTKEEAEAIFAALGFSGDFWRLA